MHSNRSIDDQVWHEASIRMQRMPKKWLEKLSNSSTDRMEFIRQLPMMQSMENARQQLIKQNRQLAMKNLKKEPDLIDKRKKLAQTLVELASLREKYLARRNDQENSSPDVILGRLQSLLDENERSNEDMVETFFRTCRNDHDVEIFMKHFLRDRQKTIELRIITEKFAHLYQIEKRK